MSKQEQNRQILLNRAQIIREKYELDKPIDNYVSYWVDMPNDLLGLTTIPDRTKIPIDIKKKYNTVDYQSLEFYGDSILYACTAHLMMEYIGLNETPGELSRIKAFLNSNMHFADKTIYLKICYKLFPQYQKNNSKKNSKGRYNMKNHNLCADSFEALIGAMYYWGAFIKKDETIFTEILEWFLNLSYVKIIISNLKKDKLFDRSMFSKEAPIKIKSNTVNDIINQTLSNYNLDLSQLIYEDNYVFVNIINDVIITGYGNTLNDMKIDLIDQLERYGYILIEN